MTVLQVGHNLDNLMELYEVEISRNDNLAPHRRFGDILHLYFKPQ